MTRVLAVQLHLSEQELDEQLEKMQRFYEESPDGQWDVEVVELIRLIRAAP